MLRTDDTTEEKENQVISSKRAAYVGLKVECAHYSLGQKSDSLLAYVIFSRIISFICSFFKLRQNNSPVSLQVALIATSSFNRLTHPKKVPKKSRMCRRILRDVLFRFPSVPLSIKLSVCFCVCVCVCVFLSRSLFVCKFNAS